jgi:hypothetical protein
LEWGIAEKMEGRRQDDNRLLIVNFGDGCVGMFNGGKCVYFNDPAGFNWNAIDNLTVYRPRVEIRLHKKWPSLGCLEIIKL